MSALGAIIVGLLHLLAQISVIVSAPAFAAARDPLLVQVDVTAPAGREVRLLAPSFAPFRVITSTSVAATDSAAARRGPLRAVWQTVEHRFVLAPPLGASGRFDFGPFEAQVSAPGLRTATARSRAWSVTVRPPPNASTALPEIVERAHIYPRSGINFHSLVVPETVYVGQQASYQVGVFLDENVRTRLRRNPEFLPPELRAMLAYELPAGRASLRDRVIAGKRWDVHVFQRAIFPLSAGRTDVPPAQLSYSLPLSLGFFSREESYTARSEPATVVALAPPTEGRPADWVGAVGVLHASTRVDTTRARVGDPVVLTLRVEGTGNVKLLPRPPLTLGWGTAVDGEERVEVDSTSLLVRGAKEFDWIVTPRAAGERQIPAVRYPYFDPYERRYELTSGAPIPLEIAPGTLAETDAPSDKPVLQIRRVDRGDAPTPLPTRPLFWVLVVLAPLPAAAIAVRRRPVRATPVRPAFVSLRDGARADAVDMRRIRRLFAQALADRLVLRASASHVASARAGAVARRLRRCGVTAETAADAEAMLRALDVASYATAPGGQTATDARALAGDAWRVYERVDQEARTSGALRSDVRRGALVGARWLAVLAMAAGAVGTARAIAAREASAAFGAGVEAYQHGRYSRAAQAFARAATIEPRSADAWANVGTSAWAVDDTVAAAVAWHRALRIEPRADDVRDRLSLLPAPQDGWIAGVPPLPLDWVALAGGALWIVGCATIAAALLGRPAPARALAAVAFIGAGAAAVIGVQVARVENGLGLAIVRERGPLHVEPALGAELGPPVEATDVARVLGRQALWSRVALDGGREGWIESERLVPLDTTR